MKSFNEQTHTSSGLGVTERNKQSPLQGMSVSLISNWADTLAPDLGETPGQGHGPWTHHRDSVCDTTAGYTLAFYSKGAMPSVCHT